MPARMRPAAVADGQHGNQQEPQGDPSLILGDLGQLGDDHQAGAGSTGVHEPQHVELPGPQHLARGEIPPSDSVVAPGLAAGLPAGT
ncbi:MAG: hypothetical protein M5U12_22115 [Verrucomicrobia bacterium]|nr:hypothetical protein [Verrucomicrobiota bacterium]